MEPKDSPFSPHWWGIGLGNADVDARPDIGTYGRYEFTALPPVPFELRGDLDWLAGQPVQDEWSIGMADVVANLPALQQNCRRLGVELPESFVAFLGSPELQRRVRSSTACYLDIDTAPVPSPVAGGHLVRFLADQQGCLFWYLYVTADNSDHAVVCTSDYYGVDDTYGTAADDEPEFADPICYTAESFEAFICRYWLENEVWFASTDDTPMPEVGAEYIERYRQIAGA